MLLDRPIAVVSSVASVFAIVPAAMSCSMPTMPMPTIAVTIAASTRVKPRASGLRCWAREAHMTLLTSNTSDPGASSANLFNQATELEDRENDAHSDKADD